MELIRKPAMPNKNTFRIKAIKELLESEINDGLWIDPFANESKIASITNDLNPKFDTDYHLDVMDFLRLFNNNEVDGILLDPPYSRRQAKECYENVGMKFTHDKSKSSFQAMWKNEISRIVKNDGKVISFGWNSNGLGKKYGFYTTRILLVAHGGMRNDTICTVEVKNQSNLFYIKEV